MSSPRPPPLPLLTSTLADPSLPIGMRMRAAYHLRHLHASSPSPPPSVVASLGASLALPAHGGLLRHELAYVLGQMGDPAAIPLLLPVLSDPRDCPMVRHECAEALGSLGTDACLAALERHSSDAAPEVSETCRIAVEYLRWRRRGDKEDKEDKEEEAPPACACMTSPYDAKDPAPPHPDHASLPEEEVGEILRDEGRPLFERYRAMFSLRNKNTRGAARELGRALVEDKGSALLRHEAAYVLGQMARKEGAEFLEQSLRRREEHTMVRHEAAEALGAIEERWEHVEKVLREFAEEDPDPVVRDSCLVALDAADYWGEWTSKKEEEEENSENQEVKDVKNVQATDSFARQKAAPAGMNHFNIAVVGGR